jgi:uncharacterized hydrophobic protein (TIGR00341 family)
MALRLIEMFLPAEENLERVQDLLKDHPALGIWQENLSENHSLIKVLIDAEETEEVIDILEKYYSNRNDFRILILPVEATLPRPEKKEDVALKEQETQPSQGSSSSKVSRISREELYSDIVDTTKLSKVYIILVILSSIVAAVGILRDNVAVIIGAMVIAPLLGPNIALSFATTLGDMDLVKRAMKANLVGILVASILSALIGFIFEINPEVPELSSRTNVGLADVALALASGSAGVLSFTAGVGSAIVGVMVAVALLPPLVSFGMLLGSAHFSLALGAMLLLLVNVICVNLAGVTTFLAQGIRPKTWWEADRAKKATRVAMLLWTFLLLVLIVAILLSQKKAT